MKIKFLIVDDSRIMRKIIKNIITLSEFSGSELIEACDGQEAYGLLKSQPFDLLLVDWNMPNLNGLELVKKIRVDKDLFDLPIIMITSEAAKYNVIEAVKAGVNDYLVKPVPDKGLLDKIRKYAGQE